jgi:ankyrin repeat protein
MRVAFACLTLGLALCSLALGQRELCAKEPPPSAATKFDKVGPQVGDQLADLQMRSMKGEEQRLSDAWRGGPALLVTSSLTCPKSRSRWPELKAISEKYGDKLNVVIVYVIEAHPVGSICPYKGVEDVTPENERDGILRKQPVTLEDRLELAQEFKRYLRIGLPIYVDDVKNEAWKAVGAAPNLALLVDKNGVVAARAGWFEGKVLEKAIDAHLAVAKKQEADDAPERLTRQEEKANGRVLEKAGLEDYEFKSAFRPYDDKEAKELARMLKQTPALVKYVFPIQQGHAYETTTLMEAVEYRHLAAVELLLKHGADVKAQTTSYDSALQIAAQNGELEIVQILLKHGADPAFPRIGKSPVHEAALAGQAEVVQVLLTAKAPADLYSDVALGNLKDVEERLATDPSLALRPDGAGRMPMDYAAANGQLQVAKLLLKTGAPVVTAKRTDLEPPLHRAIARKHADMVALLLEAGSSPDTAVGHGGEYSEWTSALHLAISAGDVAIVKLLLSKKANLKARNTYSLTPLHVAAQNDRAAIVTLLIDAGADVNATQGGYSLPCGSGREETPPKNTPLHLASTNGHPETIKVLLKAGAKLEAQTVDGVTPLMAAVNAACYRSDDQDSLRKSVEALLKAGAKVNAQDNEGRTILDRALTAQNVSEAGKGAAAIVALLREHGAKPGVAPTKQTRRREDAPQRKRRLD